MTRKLARAPGVGRRVLYMLGVCAAGPMAAAAVAGAVVGLGWFVGAVLFGGRPDWGDSGVIGICSVVILLLVGGGFAELAGWLRWGEAGPEARAALRLGVPAPAEQGQLSTPDDAVGGLALPEWESLDADAELLFEDHVPW